MPINRDQFLSEIWEVTGILPEKFTLHEDDDYYQAWTSSLCIICYRKDAVPYKWRFDAIDSNRKIHCGYGSTAVEASIDLQCSMTDCK